MKVGLNTHRVGKNWSPKFCVKICTALALEYFEEMRQREKVAMKTAAVMEKNIRDQRDQSRGERGDMGTVHQKRKNHMVLWGKEEVKQTRRARINQQNGMDERLPTAITSKTLQVGGKDAINRDRTRGEEKNAVKTGARPGWTKSAGSLAKQKAPENLCSTRLWGQIQQRGVTQRVK